MSYARKVLLDECDKAEADMKKWVRLPIKWVRSALADQGKPQVTARPSDATLVDLYWKASGDDWAIPDWLMVKYGRAVLEAALGEKSE